MTPFRLGSCLETIRWSPSTLAQCLGIDDFTVDLWATGMISIPTTVASWLEALCFTHEAADLLRPNIQNADPRAERLAHRPEHIPTYAYGLLRRLNEGNVPLRALYGTDDEGAVFFLVSRGLAERDDDALVITTTGAAMGQINPTQTNDRP